MRGMPEAIEANIKKHVENSLSLYCVHTHIGITQRRMAQRAHKEDYSKRWPLNSCNTEQFDEW